MDDLDRHRQKMDDRARERLTPLGYRHWRAALVVRRLMLAGRFRWQRAVGAAVSVLQKTCGHDLAYLPELADDSVVMSVCEFCGHIDLDDDTDHAEQVADARAIAADHEW